MKAAVLGASMFIGSIMPFRFMQKVINPYTHEGVTPSYATQRPDFLSRYRIFENQPAYDEKDAWINYLANNSVNPMTREDLIGHYRLNFQEDNRIMRVKRRGKDKNDIFWSLGKVHGLENIKFLTNEQLEES